MEQEENEIVIKTLGPACKECRSMRGHKEDCQAGKRELEEWKKLFGGKPVEEFPEDGRPKNVFTPKPPADIREVEDDSRDPFLNELPKKLEPIRMVLVNDVLRFAYNFATDKGKVRLEEVFREKREKTKDVSKLLGEDLFQILKSDMKGLLTEEERARHFEGMKLFISKEFEQVSQKSGISEDDWRHVIIDLVKNMEKFCGDIERNDEGALKIMKSLIAKMFLDDKDLEKMKEYIVLS
ncbi:MAG: hypothetical protein HZB33_13615 [Nitrospirae bacterium]|nr:hypothetical protein [Nitrospirota bacterium]